MIPRFIVIQVRVVLLVAAVTQAAAQTPTVTPHDMIADEATAIRVAEAILVSKYSLRDMEGERPYKAHLSQGVWHVWGTVPKDAFGQTLFVDIDQKAGCVLRIGAD